jgi:hypothetical protein
MRKSRDCLKLKTEPQQPEYQPILRLLFSDRHRARHLKQNLANHRFTVMIEPVFQAAVPGILLKKVNPCLSL